MWRAGSGVEMCRSKTAFCDGDEVEDSPCGVDCRLSV